MSIRPKIVFISGNTDSVSHRFRVMHTADTLDNQLIQSAKQALKREKPSKSG